MIESFLRTHPRSELGDSEVHQRGGTGAFGLVLAATYSRVPRYLTTNKKS